LSGVGGVSTDDSAPSSPARAPPAANGKKAPAASPAAAAAANGNGKAAATSNGNGNAAAKKEEPEAGADWSDEDMRLMGKAMKKFPKGYKARWEAIAAYLGKEAGEVIKVSKRFTVDGNLAKPQGSAYDKFQKDKAANLSSGKAREVSEREPTSM